MEEGEEKAKSGGEEVGGEEEGFEYEYDEEEDGEFDEEEVVDEPPDEPVKAARQTRAERERSEAASFLMANKERVRSLGDDEVDGGEFPDLDNVKGVRPTKQEATDDYLDEFSDVMLKYNKDLKIVGEAVGLNRYFPDDPPYPFLPPDFARRLITLTPAQVHKWAMMCEAYTQANNAMEDVVAGGEVVKEGLTISAAVVEKVAKKKFDVDIDGMSSRIRARLATQKPLTMRLFRKYVQPMLDKLTGGNGGGASDLMTLAFLFYKEGSDQYEQNAIKKRASEAASGGAAAPAASRHEQMAAAVESEIGKPPLAEDEEEDVGGHEFDDELGAEPAGPRPSPASVVTAPGVPMSAPGVPVSSIGGDEAMAEWQRMMGMTK